MGVKIDVLNREIEMGLGSFVAYSFWATTKSGKYVIRGTGKFAANYAAQQLKLTGYHFLQLPVQTAAKSSTVRAVAGGVLRSSPALATLVVGGIAFNAIGNTHAVQTAGHIGNPGVLGMGGTL